MVGCASTLFLARRLAPVPALTTDGRPHAGLARGPAAGRRCSAIPAGPGSRPSLTSRPARPGDERTLLLLDPRGTGGSDRPADPTAYDLADYADDIEALRSHLGLERLDLLGHSHGGFVAMAWAGAHPDRVGRLVLASTAPRFTDAIRRARADRAAEHRDQPYYADAMAALQAHLAGEYETDEELAASTRASRASSWPSTWTRRRSTPCCCRRARTPTRCGTSTTT